MSATNQTSSNQTASNQKEAPITHTPKNILITGGAGFIGSNVVCGLVEKYPQYNIINLDKMDYCSSLRNLEEVENKKNYKFVKGNICSSDFINYILKSENIDTIIHFAAQTHVDNSFGNSFQFTENNIMGTHVLLEASKANGGIKRFIHVSTDEVYGEAGNELSPTDEKHHESSTLLKPSNPYAATKAGAEFLVQAYNKSFQLPTIITRGNNVYGPKQYPEKLIPKFICLLSRKQPCPIHGNGSHKRNFIYVSDVVSAFDTILHKGEVGQVYNIGTHDEISNLTVAKNLIKLSGLQDKESEFIKFVEDRPFNDFRYSINFDRLAALGWSAKVTWEEGLKKTIDWYLTKMSEKYWDSIEGALVAHPRRGIELVASSSQLSRKNQ